MTDDFDLRDLDTFAAGTVGPPGQRIFFLQATEAGHVISLKLEKGQVWALARLLRELLGDQDYEGPASAFAPLVEPVSAAWTIGRLATGIDTENKVIVVIAYEIQDEDDDTEPEADAEGEMLFEDEERTGSRARFHLTYAMALGFAQQAILLVEEGRNFGMRNGHRPRREK